MAGENSNRAPLDIRQIIGKSFDFDAPAESVAEGTGPSLVPAVPADATEEKGKPPYGIIALGVVMIAWSLLTMREVPQGNAVSSDGSETSSTEAKMERVFDEELARSGQYPNPKLTFYEKYFCRGNSVAPWCRTLEDHFYHPKVEVLENSGVTYDQYLAEKGEKMPQMKPIPGATIEHSRMLHGMTDSR